VAGRLRNEGGNGRDVKRLCVIGIGVGDPTQVTMQAVAALQEVDVFFVTDKGEEASDLLELRTQVLARYTRSGSYRTVMIPDPPRDRGASSYGSAVQQWHDRRVALWERLLESELTEGAVGGFLVWGDPAFYDSTLRILEGVKARAATELEVEVVPGVSAMQVLAARHKISLNQIGGALTVTTGRRLSAGWPPGATDVVVMLDAQCSFRSLYGEDLHIFWGAYLGSGDEILLSGPLGACGETIVQARARARERKGWIFDTYLLRRRSEPTATVGSIASG
jgi:precorrin-6A synthase